MSSLDRHHATPEEFATLIENYYEQKKDYDHRILALLQRRADRLGKQQAGEKGKQQVTMPHHPSEENVTGSTSSSSVYKPIILFVSTQIIMLRIRILHRPTHLATVATPLLRITRDEIDSY